MSLIDNYNKCLQLIRQEKWAKAKKVILSAPDVLHFCVSGEDSVLIAALKNRQNKNFLKPQSAHCLRRKRKNAKHPERIK